MSVKPSMAPQSEVTIYALCEPSDGAVRYIGKTRYTTTRRLIYHMSAAVRSRVASANWLRSLRGKGVKPLVVELEKVPLDADWQCRERHWISEYRAAGARLLNLTDGGEGLHGRSIAGTEHARRISESLRRGSEFSCESCENKFWRKPKEIRKGDCRFCSRECYQKSLRGVSRRVSQSCKERGVAAAAKAKRDRPHCKRGHPLSGDNLYVNARGARVCKECRKIHKKTYLARDTQ